MTIPQNKTTLIIAVIVASLVIVLSILSIFVYSGRLECSFCPFLGGKPIDSDTNTQDTNNERDIEEIDEDETEDADEAGDVDVTDEDSDEDTEPQIQTHNGTQYILTSPLPDEEITSPLSIEGEISGTWYFEGQFTIELSTTDGTVLATGIATATDDWMTEELVFFTATLTFDPGEATGGILTLIKSNPSDLPEHDDQIEIEVEFI